MQLQCTYTPEDFIEAFRAKIHDPLNRVPFFQKKVVQFIILVAVVINLGWVIWWQSESSGSAHPWTIPSDVNFSFRSLAGVLVLSTLIIIANPRLASKRRWRRLWHRTASFQQPQTLTLDETGICISNPLSSYRLNWASFRGWSETQNLFVALSSDRNRVIIPKRSTSVEQIVELRKCWHPAS